jgi:two-component system response regulator AtoC
MPWKPLATPSSDGVPHAAMPELLLVEDDSDQREALAELVGAAGFHVHEAASLAEGRAVLERGLVPDVLLVDLRLPDGKGLDVLDALEDPSRTEIVLLTGHATVDSAVEAMRRGVRDYLTKPIDVARLRTILANVIRTIALKGEVGRLRGELRRLGRFGRMIGGSSAMQRVYDLIAKVAPTEASVLLTGESGTGKELAAETIHELSTRRDGPFIAVNCGAVSPTLIESELFGHERGAFTGAAQRHRGHFERAGSGTIFLDEITEMPLEAQVKLLRVLETRNLLRLGGTDSIEIDARVVAATNRSPAQAVRDGKLREDLFYRLNVFPIELPPLRQREGDALVIAEHFVTELNEESGERKRLSAAARERIAAFDWPGNVRELKNAMQRAYILAGEEITVDSLSTELAPLMAPGPAGGGLEVQVGMSIAAVERTLILATLEQVGGDKKRAAEVLGISLKTLYNRLSVYRAA